ncbi:MAG: hypothetical protein K2P81_04865 [Bacteriovoracaceae bacterium]|nr:hypothetical protein [Bacteriovoracaceae bacterium]
MLIPVWIQKTLELNLFSQAILMMLYMLFIASQWYLLGKEIDHRFKIYFRANSSIDRIVYRLLVGSTFTVMFFNLVLIFPDGWTKHFFWGFWIFLGLFYSWPTRGKIIEESVSTQFGEYRYLDNFEKTVLFLTILMVLVSIPFFPYFDNLDSLKILIDPDEKVSQQYWNFLSVNYFPFKRFPHLMYVAWCMHFYVMGAVLYLLSFYGVLRFFFSRRLSILGIFALVSSWSWTLLLQKDPFGVLLTCFPIVWVWGLLWSAKSATYRAGLMYGMLCYFGTLLNYHFFPLFPLGLLMLTMWQMNDKTVWYRQQFLKYTSLGLIGCFFVFIYHIDLDIFGHGWSLSGIYLFFANFIKRKSFYALALVGVVLLVLAYAPATRKKFAEFTLDRVRMGHFLSAVLILFLVGISLEKNLLRGFGMMWIIPFMALIPLEWVFQVISRLRSKRNFIYLLYVLICLLDSHFEVRVRITAKFFKNTPSQSHITTN